MSIADEVSAISQSILAELAAEILPLIEPGEVTASQLAEYANINPTNAKEILDAKVKAELMTKRLVRSNGRRATAYRKIV